MKAKRKAKRSEFWARSGRRLRVTRLALGITEKEAAAAAGITVRTWRKWEGGGYQKSSHYNYVCFAEKCDVNIVWLMFGEEALGRELEMCPHLRNGLAGNHLALGKIAILPVRKSEAA